jgi:uncharacterized protein with PIN domain
MAAMSFVADVMVGKLARWLRVLGLDVVYSNKLQDEEILKLATTENRIILTRDVDFAARCRAKCKVLFIAHNDWRSQLRQVVDAYGLTNFEILSRCMECNSPLSAIDKERIVEKVPPYVYQTQEHFSICQACDRVYWHGSHVDAIRRQLPVPPKVLP